MEMNDDGARNVSRGDISRDGISREEVERDWRERGFSCGLWVDPPGQIWRDFVHDVDELFMVVEGEVELDLAGLNQKPAIGEEILIPAHTIHTVRNVGESSSRWLYGYRKS